MLICVCLPGQCFLCFKPNVLWTCSTSVLNTHRWNEWRFWLWNWQMHIFKKLLIIIKCLYPVFTDMCLCGWLQIVFTQDLSDGAHWHINIYSMFRMHTQTSDRWNTVYIRNADRSHNLKEDGIKQLDLLEKFLSLEHGRIHLKTHTHTHLEIIKVYWSSFNGRRVSKATESMKCTLCSVLLNNPAGWAVSSMLLYSPVLKMTSEPRRGSIFRCRVGRGREPCGI